MKRTKKAKTPEKFDFLFGSDFHIWFEQPPCRTDNYVRAMQNKLIQIRTLQEKYQCPFLHGGDLFEFWKTSPELLSFATEFLPRDFRTVMGQHDFRNHDLTTYKSTGIRTLEINNRVTILPGLHWGQDLEEYEDCLLDFGGRKVLILHYFTFRGKEPWPGCTAEEVSEVLDKFPKADLTIIGDNHKTFQYEEDGRKIISPGSLMRRRADQHNHVPSIWGYCAGDNSIHRIVLEYEKDVISREHIDIPKEEKDRLEHFLKMMDIDYEIEFDFKDNVLHILESNDVQGRTKRHVLEAIEE